MADFPELAQEVRVEIAEEIARRLAFKREPRRPAVLLESMPVCILSKHYVSSPDRRLASSLTRTNRWHHQIRLGVRRYAYARTLDEEGKHVVAELTEGGLGKSIANAIAIADRINPGPGLTSLLLIPHQSVVALAIEEATLDHCILAQQPNRLKSLPRRRLWRSHDLLQILSERINPNPMPPPKGLS